jgi:very-short-patch-repair endonuclease
MQNLETRRPFTRTDALAAGITAKQLRGSRFRRIFRGVYIEARIPDHPLIRSQASLVLHPPTAFASHVSAGRIYRVPLPTSPHEHVTVRSKSERCTVDGIRCHVATPPDDEVTTVGGVRVSRPARMFVELASILSLVDLVVVGDALLRLSLVTLEQLVEHCEQSTDRHASAARRAASYVREKVDSAMESRLRMLIVLAGLPEPQVNAEYHDDFGNVLMKFDLSYPDLKLIIEYDGRQHAERVKQWLHDVKRREELDELHWRIVIVTSEGIYKKPADTLFRVHRALKERGCRSLPVRQSDAWRPFFPGY